MLVSHTKFCLIIIYIDSQNKIIERYSDSAILIMERASFIPSVSSILVKSCIINLTCVIKHLYCRSGLGSHYGTLSGPISAFSPNMRPGKAYASPGKNFLTNPGKKGTGFG